MKFTRRQFVQLGAVTVAGLPLVQLSGCTSFYNSPTLDGHVDLGRVAGVSELSLNGVRVGQKWFGRHLYDVSGALKEGDNTLTIRITTTLGNYMKSLPDNKDAEKWMKKQSLYPNGLLGPVKIM